MRSRLKEAFYGEHARSLLLVEYDHLVNFPGQTLKLIYEFLGEPLFEHRFDTLQYDAREFDAGIATPGLHRVRPSVQPVTRQTVLPPDLRDRLSQLNFWRQPGCDPVHVVGRSSFDAGGDPDATEDSSPSNPLRKKACPIA